MKSIAFYTKEPLKINQGFFFQQISMLKRYQSIVIGPYPDCENALFPFENYYQLKEIKKLGTFFHEKNIAAIHVLQGKHAQDVLPIALTYHIPLIVHFRGRDCSTQTTERFRQNVLRYQYLVRHIAGCYAVCQFLAEELKDLGFPKDKIHVLYGGLNL